MTLILHKGAELIPYEGLRALSTPAPTETHVPIPHFRIVDIVKHMLAFYGHEVVEEAHGATEDGAQYFGLLTLKSHYGNYTDNIGLRNSHNKKFPIGMCFGSTVFVCDNLAFSSNQVVARKHTKNAKHELPALISSMVEPLADQREAQHRNLLRYQTTALTDQLAHHAIMQMYKQDVINVTRIPDVLEQWEKPSCDWGERSVWRLFNACTFALAGKVAENPTSTTTLHRLMDNVCDIVDA